MKRKTDRVMRDFLLSVKYASLKEELGDIEAKKRLFLGGKDKRHEKLAEQINAICKQINEIEQSSNPSSYSLIVENKAKEQLQSLSKQKDFHLIMYSIAVEMIMDEESDYLGNKSDFAEKISMLLFGNKDIIKKMKDDYERISARIYGKSTMKDHIETGANLILKAPLAALLNSAGSIKAAALAVLATTQFAVGGIDMMAKRKKAKKLTALSSGDFAKRLVICALNLLYAKNFYTGELEYANYFRSKLKEINLERRIIMEELFEKQYEIKDNQLKIELLHNFDEYLIEQINLMQK